MDTKALRQKILDLAIHGKLVPQDPNDEPASVLLQRIRAEKERLIAEGKIKRPKKSKASSSESHYRNFTPPFPIPDSWQWVRLEDVCELLSGRDLDNNKCNDSENGLPYLIGASNIQQDTFKFIRWTKYPEVISFAKDILISCKGTIGELLINEYGDIHIARQFMAIRPLDKQNINIQYLYYVLRSGLEQIKNQANGIIPGISRSILLDFVMPIPPLVEQEKIVKKIELYLDCIDKIEHNKTSLISIVSTAKSKILELAMQGKLIPQDPADEPAADMLRRVNPKARIITDTPHSRNIPEGWCETTLIEVANLTMGQSPSGESINLNDGLEFHQGKLYFGEKWIEESPQKTSNPTKLAKPLDILLCVRAPVGVVNFTSRHICIGRGLCAVTIDRTILNVDFAYYYLQYLKTYFENNAIGSTFLAISGETVKKTPLLLPPLSEQQKIIERVEELYSVLDEIEASLQS